MADARGSSSGDAAAAVMKAWTLRLLSLAIQCTAVAGLAGYPVFAWVWTLFMVRLALVMLLGVAVLMLFLVLILADDDRARDDLRKSKGNLWVIRLMTALDVGVLVGLGHVALTVAYLALYGAMHLLLWVLRRHGGGGEK